MGIMFVWLDAFSLVVSHICDVKLIRLLLCRMANATWIALIYVLVCMLVLFKVDGGFVNITYVENAVEKGAGNIIYLSVQFFFIY